MHQTVRWHVIYTKQQCERKVLHALIKKGYRCYCPCYAEPTPWTNQDKAAERPLFSSYVFVQCSEEHFPDIKRNPGVINFLYRLNCPAEIDTEDMEAIANIIQHYQKVQVLKTGLNTSRQVTDQEGDFFTLPLPSLGFTLTASKEKPASGKLIQDGELRRTLQWLSYRFRLAWR